jgi:hypothetical protein
MIAFGWLLWTCWSSIDGEPFVGDQEYFYEPDQQDQYDQGKYRMRSSLFSINFNSLIHPACVFLVKDAQELILYLDSYGYGFG